MTDYRLGIGSKTDYREVIPGEIPRNEFLVSRLRQECLPLPDTDTAILAMQRTLGQSTQKTLSKQDMRRLTVGYLLAFRDVELARASQNAAISNVASALLALHYEPAIGKSVDDVLLAIHAYFWLGNITAEALLESLEH
ncbi:hypothetical protein ACTXM3_02000 [Glutamicibacter arilaitensis]|uniref:hypothetical protein n=1 Tax=Glutamicibacter arilaitensis TaxID=256701 RepID=UPI003FCEF438